MARHWFAVAKLAVAALWWMALIVLALAEAMAIGLAMGLPGFSVELAATGIANAFLASAVSFLLASVVARIAVWSRGEVAAIAFSLVMLALGNLFGKTGWAEWFPYSIVPLLIGMVADPSPRQQPQPQHWHHQYQRRRRAGGFRTEVPEPATRRRRARRRFGGPRS